MCHEQVYRGGKKFFCVTENIYFLLLATLYHVTKFQFAGEILPKSKLAICIVLIQEYKGLNTCAANLFGMFKVFNNPRRNLGQKTSHTNL